MANGISVGTVRDNAIKVSSDKPIIIIGSSLLIMAIGGGAILPLVYGRLADLFSPQQAYWILIPCYIVIWYFAYSGHKIRSHKVTVVKI